MAIAFKQGNSASNAAGGFTSQTVTYTSAQTAAGWNGVAIAWDTNGSTVTISSVKDTKTNGAGGVYQLAGHFTDVSGTGYDLSFYYAENIASALASGNVVTVTYSAAVGGSLGAEVSILEYSGVATSGSFDQFTHNAAATGTALSTSSLTPAVANSVAIEWTGVLNSITASGTFTTRVTTGFSDIAADKIVSAATPGAATQNVSGAWAMGMVIFKPPSTAASDVIPMTGGGRRVVDHPIYRMREARPRVAYSFPMSPGAGHASAPHLQGQPLCH